LFVEVKKNVNANRDTSSYVAPPLEEKGQSSEEGVEGIEMKGGGGRKED